MELTGAAVRALAGPLYVRGKSDGGGGGGVLSPAALLLGTHDHYLDLRSRQVILSDKTKHRAVWQTVSNPGAVLRAGRIVGVWRARAARDGLALTMTLFEPLPPARREDLAVQAEALAAFRGLTLRELTVVDPV